MMDVVIPSVLGVVGGLGLFVTAFWLRIRVWRKARARAEKDLAAKIDELLAEFPSECQTWGGRTALQEPDVVREVIRELEAVRGGSPN
jgi:hypothetical protein